jgi:steroid 5-alpha reductase family enzyme
MAEAWVAAMPEALLVNAAILGAAMTLLWTIAARIKDVSFIDAVWGGAMAALGVLSWIQLQPRGPRASLIAALTLIWGARLGWHLYTRWIKHGEDRRYARMLGKAKREGRYGRAAAGVFGGQAVLLYITCLPAQIGVLASAAAPIGPLALAGAALWLLGFAFETVGDHQLTRFRADPANAGKVLSSGLWRYTRHPNYFGDACVWWGIWLAAAEAGWWTALVTLAGPLFLTFTLTRWSGKPLLEKRMDERRPEYADYVRRTSGFIPWPPAQ